MGGRGARVSGGAAICLVLVSVLAACGGAGGGGAGSGERPSLTSSISPTRTLPSPTRSDIRTEEPSTSDPASPETSEASPTTPPSTSPTDETTGGEQEQTSATAETSSTPAETDPSAEAEDGSSDDAVPTWVWWVLGGLLAAGIAVAAVLSARARRRRRWLQQLESAEADVVWLARELLPQLRDGGSPERVAGGWEVGLPRVGAVEDQLTVLEASARAEEDAVRARALRDAVRGARARVDALTAGGPQEQWALERDEAIALLESALATSTQPG